VGLCIARLRKLIRNSYTCGLLDDVGNRSRRRGQRHVINQVSFEYEWHDDSLNWYRSYGVELWEFEESGLMRRRIASINDDPIAPSERRIQ
jgi:nuclear transport factor 2 (NTF2) superfamily protein